MVWSIEPYGELGFLGIASLKWPCASMKQSPDVELIRLWLDSSKAYRVYRGCTAVVSIAQIHTKHTCIHVHIQTYTYSNLCTVYTYKYVI